MLDSISIEKNQNNVQAVKDSTAQVSASNTTNTIFNSTADTQGNVDKQSASIINCSETQNNNELTSQQNKNKIYKQIEELCVEYRIDIEDAKKAN